MADGVDETQLTPAGRKRWGGLLLVAVSGVIMLRWSWLTWPDPLIDFGRELYVPWQLSQGKVLYRDIVSYFNGPLAPYLHALLFRVFGPSLHVLIGFNLLVIAALAAMLQRLLRLAAGRGAAAVGGVLLFTLFAFAQFLITGNYNFVCPYSYELSHGLTLTAALLLALEQWQRGARRGWLVLAGVLLGLILLTKAEIGIAALAAAGAFIGSAGLIASAGPATPVPPRRRLFDAAVLFGVAGIVILSAYTLLLRHLSPIEARNGLLGALRWSGDRALRDLPYFRQLAGTDDVGHSLRIIAAWGGGYLALFGAAAVLGRWMRVPCGVKACAITAAALLGWFWPPPIDWNQFVRPLPLLIIAVALFDVWAALCHRCNRALAIALSVWSLALLTKMPLNAHIYHYGFALALPLTLWSAAVLVGRLPRWLESISAGRGQLLQTVVLAGLALVVAVHLRLEAQRWSIKQTLVGQAGDSFLADPRGLAVNNALRALHQFVPPGATLAVIPEGLILNYLSRHENPTGQLNFTPPAVLMYGEDEMRRAFAVHPPDFVMVIGFDTEEYGARTFGQDYAGGFNADLGSAYAPLASIPPPRGFDPSFTMTLMKRR